MIRLLALDVDGTLLRSDGSVSQRTKRVLRLAESRGTGIVIATARPPRTVVQLAQEAGIADLAICQNGALIFDLATSSVRERAPIRVDVAVALIHRLKARLPACALASEAGEVFRYEAGYQTSHAVPANAEISGAEALADERLTKLIIQDVDRPFEELLLAVTEEVGDLAQVSYSGTAFVEITALGVTKLAALQRIADERGISASEVAAFGDMPIDIPMLLWAGTGVAMANAHHEVLAAIAERTTSNDEDGIAMYLEALGFV